MPARVVAPISVKCGSVRCTDRRRFALADHDVDRKVLHGRVKDLFHLPVQAVDFIDKQHVAGRDGI